MLTLRDCDIKEHTAWWDVEAEIQRELEALDAEEVINASGDTQMEAMEEERMLSTDHFADNFEILMNRLQLQNEKLLHFEQSVFLPNDRLMDPVHEDTERSLSPRVDLELSQTQTRGSDNCFLALQNFIRPLCSVDQEDNCCYNDAYKIPNKNTGLTTRLEGYQIRPAKGLEPPRKGHLPIVKTEDVKSSPCILFKTIDNARETEAVDGHLKDRLLHALCLSCKAFSFQEVKVPNMLQLQISTHAAAISSSTQRRNLTTFTISKIWNAGAASEFCSQAGPHLMDVKPLLTQLITHLQRAHSRGQKQKPLIYDFLDLFKSKVIPVSGTSWDMTRPRVLKYSLLSAWDEPLFGACSNSMIYDAYEGGLQVLLSLFPELEKLMANMIDHWVLPSQYIWMELVSQLFSLDHNRLFAEVASEEDESMQILPYMKHTQLFIADTSRIYECERSKEFPPCTLAVAGICNEDGGEVLQDEKDGEPDRCVHLDKLIKLQAAIRGFLARKHYKAKLGLHQTKFCYHVIKLQACWRGWTARNSNLAEIALLNKKKADFLACQRGSLVDHADKMTTYSTVVTLQALVRGALARKHAKILLSQREKKTCNSIARVQATWRGWRVRKWNRSEKLRDERRLQEAAVAKAQAAWRGWRTRQQNLLEKLCAEQSLQESAIVKIQAVWRGFRTRRRFWMAVETCRYDDEDDDYEYAAVDDIDIPMGRVWFDNCARVCHDTSKQSSQLPSGVGGKGARDLEQDDSWEGSKVTGKEQAPSKNEDGMKSSRDFVESDDFTDCFKESSEDSPSVYDDYNQKTEGASDVKQQIPEETKTAVAEIARDWGFKEERTAVQFLRALENTKRRGECPKTKKPDSQTRLRAFMARCGGHQRLQHKEYVASKP